MNGDEISRLAEDLRRRAGCSAGGCTVTALAPGANNRVFRVESSAGLFVMKKYFFDPQDPRDRLGKEFAFLRLAWDSGLRCVPRPLAQDPEARAGLYGFVPGRKLAPAEVTRGRVEEMLEFYLALNRLRALPSAAALAEGSEASFSLEDHFHSFLWRAEKFRVLEPADDMDREAAALVRRLREELWPHVHELTLAAYRRAGLDPSAALPRHDRRISPSDFGFHNALLADDKLCFLDFEYAGWDDPAKMVCDFFLQPEAPVPADLFPFFAGEVAAEAGDRRRHMARFQALFPVHRLKWCCLLLNEFLPEGRKRREFAAWLDPADFAARKALQLRKAARCLKELPS
ncbi:MAG: aminoglycoside phosphotransferase family protein [Elusimicrobia bacterium]|nr:aminoglycoside phosphotransferase family protein [Elusimicrobiota bacterium]